MSDHPAHDTAIEAIDAQLADLDNDIQASTRRLEVDTAVRDRLLELRATLSRKPKARRPRVVEPVATPAEVASILGTRPLDGTQPADGWRGFTPAA